MLITHFYLNKLDLLGIILKTVVSNYGNKETKGEKKKKSHTHKSTGTILGF